MLCKKRSSFKNCAERELEASGNGRYFSLNVPAAIGCVIVRPVAEFLKRHVWIVFLAHQLLIFSLAVGFLTSVRRLTGRTIHAGRDPIGPIDGAILVILSIVVIAITWALYHWVKGKDAPSLGLKPSLHRLIELIAGLLIGFVVAITPYITALLSGTASVQDQITAHFSYPTAAKILSVAFFLLLLQSVMEETANRAFPMRLWDHRSLIFRIVVPSIFFAALHLADEQFSLERIVILLLGGIVQSLAYALTGNIWLTSGLHAGANSASFSLSGLWHAGGVVAVVGWVSYSKWASLLLMFIAFSIAVGISRKFFNQRE